MDLNSMEEDNYDLDDEHNPNFFIQEHLIGYENLINLD